MTEKNYTRPLVAYAYLAETGAQDDILSGLIPIITPIASQKTGLTFDPDHLKIELERLYGIEVHPWALDELIPRMVKANILNETKVSNTKSIYRYIELPKTQEPSTTEDDIQKILDDLVEYTKEITKKTLINIDDEQLKNQFLEQLVTINFKTIPIKNNAQNQNNKLTLNKDHNIEPEEDIQPQIETPEEKTINIIKIICASYILHTSTENEDIYKKLIKIATGAILAEFILNLREPSGAVSLKGLKLYLDGPLVMSYLDLDDEQAFKHSKLLLDKLAEKGAILCIFKEHVDEIRDNLKAAISDTTKTGTQRPTHRRLKGTTFKRYAQSILTDIDAELRRKKISIIPNVKSGLYLTIEKEEILTNRLGSYAYHARARDASAVASVIRLRSGKITSRSYFHECQHIFVTENKQVAARSFEFSLSEAEYKESYVPPAITDRYLAGLMLVLYGGKGAIEIADRRLLANCASALEPNHELLGRVTNFLKDANGERAEKFISMMTNSRAAQYRAIYLLSETSSINSIDDAEKAFVDFESEIRESVEKIHKLRLDELNEEHTKEINSLKDEVRLESDAAAEIEKKKNKEIEELTSTLSETAANLDRVTSAQKAAIERELQREEEDISQVLHDAIQTTKLEQSLFSTFIFLASLSLLAAVTYFSLNVSSVAEKIIATILLVTTPAAITFIGKRSTADMFNKRTRRKFEKLLSKKPRLLKASADYDISFSQKSITRRDDEANTNITADL